MGPEQQPEQAGPVDPFEDERTITVVLWDDTVEVINAGSAAPQEDGSIILWAGGPDVARDRDAPVAQYAPGLWRSWYAETDGEAIDRAMQNRHPLRTVRWRIGAWLVHRLGGAS